MFLVHALALAFLFVGTSESSAESVQERPPQDPLKHGVAVPAGAVAVVNGLPLSIEDFVNAAFEKWRSTPLGVEALDDLIRIRIIEHHMKQRGIEISPAQIQAEYNELERRLKANGQGNIASLLSQQGHSESEFRSRLRIQLALKTMAKADLPQVQNVSDAHQTNWLRGKIIDAGVVVDQQQLPKNAAARINGQLVTRSEFVRNLLSKVEESEVAQLALLMQQRTLCQDSLKRRGLEIGQADIDAQYSLVKSAFEADPKYQGVPYEDVIKQVQGMDAAAWKRSAGFYIAAATASLGKVIVADDDVPQLYRDQAERYGPIYELQHILLRGSDDPKHKGLIRTKSQSKRKAQELRKRLDEGEDFGDAAKVYSDDNASKFSGAVLGRGTPLEWQRQPKLYAALKDMKVGDIAGPIEGKSGYHVIRMSAKEPLPPLSAKISRDIKNRAARKVLGEEWDSAKKGLDLRRFIGRP